MENRPDEHFPAQQGETGRGLIIIVYKRSIHLSLSLSQCRHDGSIHLKLSS
jgi:hypothetical protein